MCGSGNPIAPVDPTTSSFIHGFFSVAQRAARPVRASRRGLLARWGIFQLLGLDSRSIK
jgi:hypothetical protein